MNATALVCYLLLVSTPLLGVDVGGRVRQAMLGSIPQGFDQRDMPLLALLMLATLIAFPIAQIASTLVVLGGLRRPPARPALLARLARARHALARWSMPEVFLLGMFVAYSRMKALAPAQLGVAAFALGGLVFAKVATEALLDEHEMWERIRPSPPVSPHTLEHFPTERNRSGGSSARQNRGLSGFREPRRVEHALVSARSHAGPRLIACTSCGFLAEAEVGSPCPRCGATLRPRRQASLARTWAFLVAAAALYGPANFLPIMTFIRYARGEDYTILGGMQELLTAGEWPLALLVFVASFCVPLLKIIGILVLLVSTHLRMRTHLHDRTRLYRVIEIIGRWSMIDVFMVAILTALVQMGQLATVIPCAGAPCFAAVVVLTMLSAASFDPRLMWDAAAQQRRTPTLLRRAERRPA